jgi:hypothetical protein
MTEEPPASGDPDDEHIVSLNDDVPISTAIVRAVAAVDGRPTEELPLLHDAVDTGSLETLLDTERTDGPTSRTTITFEYAGYEATVTVGGELRLRAIDDPE